MTGNTDRGREHILTVWFGKKMVGDSYWNIGLRDFCYCTAVVQGWNENEACSLWIQGRVTKLKDTIWKVITKQKEHLL